MTGSPAEPATVDALDPRTRALVRLAAAIATGRRQLLAARVEEVVSSGAPPIWVDELLLQSVLMVGYPRALGALGLWRERVPEPASLEDGTDYRQQAAWIARGEGVCRTVYGANYEKLRQNVRGLHPAVDAWMVTEGYGRTIGRPGLDLARRELCVVAQCAVLGAERQLHSHLRGSLNAGVPAAVVAEVLDAVAPDQDATDAEMSQALWKRIAG